MKKNIKELEVGDIVRLNRPNGYRVWKITGVYLGSNSTETMIGMTPIDKRKGYVNGHDVKETLVPRELTYQLEIV